MLREMKMLARKGTNVIKSNFDAGGNTLYGGTREMRSRLVRGFEDLGRANKIVKNAEREQLADSFNRIEQLKNQLKAVERNTPEYDRLSKELEAANETLMRQRRELHSSGALDPYYEQRAQARVDALSDIGGSIKDWAMATDYAGQGGRRAGVIAARVGGTTAAWMGANIGFRYLRGGTATRNPQGERDIAGIPLV